MAKRTGQQGEQWQPAESVGWYDPMQLLKTGRKVVSSTMFAENADGRLIQPLFDPSPAPHREDINADGTARERITIDYIADTGDAFDPSYAILYHATRDLSDGGGNALPHGEVLVLGGDQVYPTASDADYDQRLVRLLRMASGDLTANRTALYAIPGNHDWYDNLVAFRRLFIGEPRIGNFMTRQRRSYFVLQLPNRWWLFAPDVQLGSELDSAQYQYLMTCARQLTGEDKVILCNAEPHWVTDNERRQSRETQEPMRSRLLIKLEEALDRQTGGIRCLIAGDLHHYRRHRGILGGTKRETELITAGGGGAFLHPTHGWRDGSDPGLRGSTKEEVQARNPGYEFCKAYPDPATSRRLAGKLRFGFIGKNARFFKASAVPYGVMSVLLLWRAHSPLAFEPAGLALDALASPGVVLVAAAMVAGFYAFTDTSSRRYRTVAGVLHGSLHVAFAFVIPLGLIWLPRHMGVYVAGGFADALLGHFLEVLLACVVATAVGAFVGCILMGLYLYVSLNAFGRHRNESFSALRSPLYKSFLRIVVEKDSACIYAFGLEKPPSKWQGLQSRDRGLRSLLRRAAGAFRPANRIGSDPEPDPVPEDRSAPLERLHPQSPAEEPFLIETVRLRN